MAKAKAKHEDMFPQVTTLANIVEDATIVNVGLIFEWRPRNKEVFFKTIKVNGYPALVPSGESDALSPYPSPPPLKIGYFQPRSTIKIEWSCRVRDDVNGLALYGAINSINNLTRLAVSGPLKASDIWSSSFNWTIP